MNRWDVDLWRGREGSERLVIDLSVGREGGRERGREVYLLGIDFEWKEREGGRVGVKEVNNKCLILQ